MTPESNGVAPCASRVGTAPSQEGAERAGRDAALTPVQRDILKALMTDMQQRASWQRGQFDGHNTYDDAAAALRAALTRIDELERAMQTIVHATAPSQNDDAYHENAYSVAVGALGKRFCPYCNPCDGRGNEHCRKPVAVASERAK